MLIPISLRASEGEHPLRPGNNQVQRRNALLGLPGARRQAVLERIPRSDTVSHPAPRQRSRTSHPPGLNSIPGDGRTKESLGFTFPPRHGAGSAWLIEPQTLSLQFPVYPDACARRDHGLFAQPTIREDAWPVAAWLRALEFGWKPFIDRKQRWIARCLRSIEVQANGNRRGLYSLKASNGSIEAARRAGRKLAAVADSNSVRAGTSKSHGAAAFKWYSRDLRTVQIAAGFSDSNSIKRRQIGNRKRVQHHCVDQRKDRSGRPIPSPSVSTTVIVNMGARRI